MRQFALAVIGLACVLVISGLCRRDNQADAQERVQGGADFAEYAHNALQIGDLVQLDEYAGGIRISIVPKENKENYQAVHAKIGTCEVMEVHTDYYLLREKGQEDFGSPQDYVAVRAVPFDAITMFVRPNTRVDQAMKDPNWSEQKMETAIRQFEAKIDNDDTLDAANKQLVKDGFRKSLKKAFETERAKTEGR